MDEKLSQVRGMVVTALFVNYKLDEDPIMRSTIVELLKPLAIKELKTFMLTLTKTPRNYRSVLELVSDVVDETVKKRFDTKVTNTTVKALQTKFDALINFASTQISNSSFDNETAYLNSLDVKKLKEKDHPLFSEKELFVIDNITFKTLLMLHSDDPFIFEKRIVDAIALFDNQEFAKHNLISASKPKQAIENVNEPEIIEALAHDKRV
jgi:hypothetical protein